MLVKNPITSFLYIFGYNGIENIHEYWVDNREAITNSYIGMNKKKDVQEDLIAFKYKVRWGSAFGMFIRLGIDKQFRKSSGRELDFKAIKVRYGKKYLGIEAFSQQTTVDEHRQNYVDLRGISILKKVLHDSVVKNVDFSYAALDSCEFINVTFSDCRFEKTSFCNAKLIDCHFLNTCMLIANDFSKTLIDSKFDCEITQPKIKCPRFPYLFKWRLSRDSKKSQYSKYTQLKNDSFSEMCNDDKVKKSLGKTQVLIGSCKSTLENLLKL